MVRDLNEVVASQHVMLERAERQGTKLNDQQLIAQYVALLKRTQQAFAAADVDVLYVDHRQCIEHPAEVAQQLQSFFGGQLDAVAAASVVRADLYRQKATAEAS